MTAFHSYVKQINLTMPGPNPLDLILHDNLEKTPWKKIKMGVPKKRLGTGLVKHSAYHILR